jgi:hypothetical protein
MSQWQVQSSTESVKGKNISRPASLLLQVSELPLDTGRVVLSGQQPGLLLSGQQPGLLLGQEGFSLLGYEESQGGGWGGLKDSDFSEKILFTPLPYKRVVLF